MYLSAKDDFLRFFVSCDIWFQICCSSYSCPLSYYISMQNLKFLRLSYFKHIAGMSRTDGVLWLHNNSRSIELKPLQGQAPYVNRLYKAFECFDGSTWRRVDSRKTLYDYQQVRDEMSRRLRSLDAVTRVILCDWVAGLEETRRQSQRHTLHAAIHDSANLWHPLLSYWYSYKASSCARLG